MKSLVDQQAQTLQNMHLSSPSSECMVDMPPLPLPPHPHPLLNGIDEGVEESFLLDETRAITTAQKSYQPEVTIHDQGRDAAGDSTPCALNTKSPETYKPP
jgi:hypothetical protein